MLSAHINPPKSLPVTAHLKAIWGRLKEDKRLILTATPGSGKTTLIPRYLATQTNLPGEVWVLQPRRIAARLTATFIAQQMGEPIGQTVGYHIRHEEKHSNKTRLRFFTEGMFRRWLQKNPTLEGVSVLVFDEFHERHIDTDFSLAVAKKVQESAALKSNTTLHLLIMSATLDTKAPEKYLDCSSFTITGREFPVTIEHYKHKSTLSLERQVADAIQSIVFESDTNTVNKQGDILIFLPGKGEITRAIEATKRMLSRLTSSRATENKLKQNKEITQIKLFPLHGSLSTKEQNDAVAYQQNQPYMKIIFATNVAESAVTIGGITVVIDSGLARVSSFNPYSGARALTVQKISKASATQRCGRAGRTAPGRCIRLYSRQDYNLREQEEKPEILRQELSRILLELYNLKLSPLPSQQKVLQKDGLKGASHRLSRIEWLSNPSDITWETAENLLYALGALADGEITKIGISLLKFPLHPRHARVLLKANNMGIGQFALLPMTLLAEGMQYKTDRSLATDSDLLNLCQPYFKNKKLPYPLKTTHQQLKSILCRDKFITQQKEATPLKPHQQETLFRECLLYGYPDRVARIFTQVKTTKKSKGKKTSPTFTRFSDLEKGSVNAKREVLICDGTRAFVGDESAVKQQEWVIVLDAKQSTIGTHKSQVVTALSGIEEDWLLGLPQGITEKNTLLWNRKHQRVERAEQILYKKLPISDQRLAAHAGKAAGEILFDAIKGERISLFYPDEDIELLRNRIALLLQHVSCDPNQLPDLSENGAHNISAKKLGGLWSRVRSLCDNVVSLRELKALQPMQLISYELSPTLQQQLLKWTPLEVTVADGHTLTITYHANKAPSVSGFIKNFFGIKDTPKVACGHVPLTLHILAPNHRDIQVTNDLKSFWENHYPPLRKQLKIKYPRHPWPENPI